MQKELEQMIESLRELPNSSSNQPLRANFSHPSSAFKISVSRTQQMSGQKQRHLSCGSKCFKVKRRRLFCCQSNSCWHPPSAKRAPKQQHFTMSTSFLSPFLLIVVTVATVSIAWPSKLNLVTASSSVTSTEARVAPISGANFTSSMSYINSNNNNSNNNNKNQTTATTDYLLNLVKTNFNNGSRLPASLKSRPGQQRELMHYKTLFACEGNQLELSCDEGKWIHLVRASYGRFSLSICNEFGHSNYSVQCASFRAFLIMQTRCNKLSNCSVVVSQELFGDPCAGTSKYLEVQYYCDDVNNKQPQEQSTHQVAGPPQVADTIGTPVGEPGGHKSPAPSPSSPNNKNGAADLDPIANEPVGGNAPGETTSGSSVIQQQHPSGGQLVCGPQTSPRNLYWNATRFGQLAKQNCPEGSTGKVSWFCDSERGRFTPAWSPDFSQCKSTWLSRLAQQLEKMLETPSTSRQQQQQQQQSAEMMRQQNEQLLKIVLNDLSLMARTKELFSEDLKRIDIMIRQMIEQLRSLSVLFGGFNSWRSPGSSGNFGPLYEELFVKLVNIVSSLFDVSQRNAWLEIQTSDARRALELRFLGHLKDAGVLVASAYGIEQTFEHRPLRQPNVFAGISVIDGHDFMDQLSSSSSLNSNQNELLVQLRQSQQANLNRFVTEPDEQTSDFKLHPSVLRELVANGIARILMLDIKKPDYTFIKQQLEFATANNLANEGPYDSNTILAEPQSSTRIFGVFAIVGENNDLLDGESGSRQKFRMADLLTQWPISVDFKIRQATAVNSNSGSQASGSSGNQLPMALSRQCNSLSDTNQSQSNRCQTLRSNATNHVCRCDQFGFVALISVPSNQVPTAPTNDPQWPQLSELNPLIGSGPSTSSDYLDPRINNPMYGPAPVYNDPLAKQTAPSGSMSLWATIFIVVGLTLLVVALASFIMNAIFRASAQSRLNKKQSFLSAGASILGSHQRAADLSGGPTTGPLADHNLMGAPIISGSNNSGTTQSTSIIGLTQSACHGYKTHQQLYAAHLPPIEGYVAPPSRWASWFGWLNRPASRWFGWPSPANCKGDHMIQHRIVGASSLTNPNSNAFKGQYQNGYTTSLHQQSSAQLPLAAPSSSTSSYVSSSAYYEEIGPGNLTKVNTSQLAANSRTHTIVEPFKRQPAVQATSEQQQLLSIGHPQSIHHLNNSHWSPTAGNQTTAAFTLEPQHHQHNNLGSNYGQPLTAMLGHKMHNDLSQLQANSQSSSSSAGSQHSASTNVTTANGSTPRHYLFASPSAVSAYKVSMSQQTLHNHHMQHHHHHHQQQQQQQQHQQQHQLQQQLPFKGQDSHARLMQG